MGLDPALNLLNGNGFTSQIWGHPGSETLFLAYLPLQGLVHFINQSILPFDIYWVRFPWAIYLLIGALIVYKTFKKGGVETAIALLATVLILNEKSLFETTRGVRIESLIFLIISSIWYCKIKEWKVFQAFLSSTLLIAHPNVWPIALVFFLDASFNYNNSKLLKYKIKPNPLWLFPIIILIGYLFFINFDIELWKSQFLFQGENHKASSNFLTKIYDHLITRFWPYYKTQPWVPSIIYIALFLSVKGLIKRRTSTLQMALLLTHFVWFIILGPYHRYNNILFYISVFYLVKSINLKPINLKNPKLVLVSIILLLLTSVDVASRHGIAILQRDVRNPYPAIEWIKQNLSNEATLVAGHNIAYYATAETKTDYLLHNEKPYKFNFDQYSAFVIIADKQLNIKGLNLKSEYESTSVFEKKLKLQINKPTYRNLYYYKTNNKAIFNESLLFLNSTNTKVR